VAIFVDGGYCGLIKRAYDTASGRSIDFATGEGALRMAIMKSYAVSPVELAANNGDVFAWATYPGNGGPHRSRSEFLRRYPQR
jgi:hypothetical protein